jgi:hypothetical protein
MKWIYERLPTSSRGVLWSKKRTKGVNIAEECSRLQRDNKLRGKEITQLLLDQQRHEVEITEGVVRAASANKLSIHRAEIISMLLD